MNLEEGLYAFLTTHPVVSTLVGTRIYPLLVPEDAALPAIAYQRISARRTMAHDGPTGLSRPRIQLTVTGSTYSQVKQIADAIRVVLDGFRGQMGGSVQIAECHLDNEIDGYVFETDRKTVRQDYLILQKE